MPLTHLKPGKRMSQAACIGDIAFPAGQVPTDLTADIATQTRQVLDGIDQVMAEQGGCKADMASVRVWLGDMADFAGVNAAWDEWSDPSAPAQATGGVALVRPGMRVEMIAVARLRTKSPASI